MAKKKSTKSKAKTIAMKEGTIPKTKPKPPAKPKRKWWQDPPKKSKEWMAGFRAGRRDADESQVVKSVTERRTKRKPTKRAKQIKANSKKKG